VVKVKAILSKLLVLLLLPFVFVLAVISDIFGFEFTEK